jgi:taurine dioxygenase
MASINVQPLQGDLGFGARVTGVTQSALEDAEARRQLQELFEKRGLIVFDDLEPSSRMQVAISKTFGPLKPHPVHAVPRVDEETMPGVIDIQHYPENSEIVEIEGKQIANWIPWHFDHCYNNELNRAGVLRAIIIPREGGMTGFADGMELYRSISPELREKVEASSILYSLDLGFASMRFGLPNGFREIRPHPGVYDVIAQAKMMPRAIHPAVWTRKTGEKILHVSPWMALGIEHQENPEGEALLEALCQEIIAKAHPYFHKWKLTQMLIWDNWRVLHCVSGNDPSEARRMHRTTIQGDYGLGRFENNAKGGAVLEMTV